MTHHRHHKAARGHKFSIGAIIDGRLCGVAIVARPVSRVRDDGKVLEVKRLATDGTRNACSFLYGACAREAFKKGAEAIGTYILASEPGTSLRAAGWVRINVTKGRSWNVPGRPRLDNHPIEDKVYYGCVSRNPIELGSSSAGSAPRARAAPATGPPPLRSHSRR